MPEERPESIRSKIRSHVLLLHDVADVPDTRSSGNLLCCVVEQPELDSMARQNATGDAITMDLGPIMDAKMGP